MKAPEPQCVCGHSAAQHAAPGSECVVVRCACPLYTPWTATANVSEIGVVCTDSAMHVVIHAGPYPDGVFVQLSLHEAEMFLELLRVQISRARRRRRDDSDDKGA